MKFIYPIPISARLTGPLVLAPGAVQGGQLLLAPTVEVELDDLRVAFSAPAPAVAGVNVRFFIRSIRVGDDLAWNDQGGGGTDVDYFAVASTLRNMLFGRRATPAQPIFIDGDFRNLGSIASVTSATVSASAIGRKA